MLDDFSKDLNRVIDVEIYKEIKYSKPDSKIRCEYEFIKYFKKRENSFICDLFYSTIMSKFTCLCQYQTYSFQNIMDIPLLLPKDIKIIELEKLLTEFSNMKFSSLKLYVKIVKKY